MDVNLQLANSYRSVISMLICLMITGSSCHPLNGKPGWMENLQHATSPDGMAHVYQTSSIQQDSTTISISTWIQSDGTTGGAGILDLKCLLTDSISFRWKSDSVVLICYESSARIIRKENETFFHGRNITFEYKTQ